MLHDIGKLVLAMGMPEQYAQVLKQVGDRPGANAQIEMLELHAAHTDVGAYLVGLWGLPNTIAEAIAFHEDPRSRRTRASACRHRARGGPPRAPPGHRRSSHSAELGLNFDYLEAQGARMLGRVARGAGHGYTSGARIGARIPDDQGDGIKVLFMEKSKLLLVDDEPNLTSALVRSLDRTNSRSSPPIRRRRV